MQRRKHISLSIQSFFFTHISSILIRIYVLIRSARNLFGRETSKRKIIFVFSFEWQFSIRFWQNQDVHSLFEFSSISCSPFFSNVKLSKLHIFGLLLFITFFIFGNFFFECHRILICHQFIFGCFTFVIQAVYMHGFAISSTFIFLPYFFFSINPLRIFWNHLSMFEIRTCVNVMTHPTFISNRNGKFLLCSFLVDGKMF